MTQYQDIKEGCCFSNLENYDLILRAPFLYQHCVSFALNPTSVLVGSTPPLPIEGKWVHVLESCIADFYEDRTEAACQLLQNYAAPICKDASDSPLPPLWAVNHTIPLIGPDKVYPWCPSKCPDAHCASRAEKQDAYLKSGPWKMSMACNTLSTLLLTKPGTGKKGVPPKLQVVANL